MSRELSQMMNGPLGRTSQNGQKARPIRVRLASGHAIEFPPDSTSEEHLGLAQAMQNAVKAMREPQKKTVDEALKQYDPTGQTTGKIFRQARDATRTVILSMLGIDPDALPKGVMLGMVPVGPVGISKNMVDMGLGKVVAADSVKPRRGMFHSFFADEGGNLVDLGDLNHDVSISRALGEQDPVYMGNMTSLPDKLKEHKLVRLQVQPSDIAIEIHHKPTPHQVDAIAELIEKNPKAKISYDLFGDAANEFKNNVTGEDFLKTLNEFYFSGKTNKALLREALEKKLTRDLPTGAKLFGEGEVFP